MKPGPRAGIAVVLLAVAPYLPALAWEPTYDDWSHLVHNELLDRPANLLRLVPPAYFESSFPDQARPVLVATHFLDAAAGRSPIVTHAQSLLWHAAVALLVWLLLLRLGGAPGAAFVGGAVFALHPLHVEAVANASNREDVLAAFFAIGALLLALSALRRRHAGFAVAAVLAYFLALFSKESALPTPLLLGLLLAAVPALRPETGRWPRVVVAVLFVGALAATAAWGFVQVRLGVPSASGGAPLLEARAPSIRPILPAVAVLAGAATPPTERLRVRPPARSIHGDVRIVHAVPVVAFYALRLVVPWPLTVEYDFAPFRRPMAMAFGAVALAALAALGWWAARRRRGLTLALGWFAISIGPVSALPLLFNPIAERYLYLASVAASLAAVWALERVPPSRVKTAVVVAVLAALAVATVVRVGVWRDDATLWADACRKAPRSPRAHHNLAVALLARGRVREGERALRRAVAVEPRWLASYVELARLASRRGELEEAERRYRQALATAHPVAEGTLKDTALRELCRLLVRRGREGAARALVDESLRARPDWDEANALSGWLYSRGDEPARAVDALERVRGRRASGLERTLLLGRARAAAGDLAGARRDAAEAVRMAPADSRAWSLQADVLQLAGDAAGAARSERRARALKRLAGGR